MQELNLSVQGIKTYPSEFSTPIGSMSDALNVVIDRPNTIETRRGFKQYGDKIAISGGDVIDKMFEYEDRLILHRGSTLTYDSDGAGTWIDYSGSFSPQSGWRMREIKNNGNFYFTTISGLYKLDSLTGTPYRAGVFEGLGGTAALTGSSGFFTDDTAVAYRVVWARKDANNVLVLGPPGDRIEISNSAGATRNVDLTIYVPRDATTDYKYQIYRSGFSATAATIASDEMGLIFEKNVTSAEITAGEISFTDTVEDLLRGASLYTSPSQGDLINSNYEPPLCKDTTRYKDVALYANTSQKHKILLSLKTVGTGGLLAGDRVNIAGQDFTAVATVTGDNQFLFDTSGTDVENARTAMRDLARSISQSPDVSLNAFYLSSEDDDKATILISQNRFDGIGFSVTTDGEGSAWTPFLPSSGTIVSSDNEAFQNRVYISKQQQPESVPLLSYVNVGSENEPIRRIIGLRDCAVIFKDDGIFKISGENLTNFIVYKINNNAIIKAPEAAVSVNNSVVCMSTQGIISVNDNGVSTISDDIQRTITDFLSPDNYPNFDTATFAVAYESDDKYIFFTVKGSEDTATQEFVYGYLTNQWTKWDIAKSAGLVLTTDDKLYMADTGGYIYQERKERDASDYADEEYEVTVSAVTTNVVTLSDATQAIAGRSFVQGGKSSIITAVSGLDVTLNDDLVWNTGSACIVVPIVAEISWIPQFAKNPGIGKRFREVRGFFRNLRARDITYTFGSDANSTTNSYTSTRENYIGWGNTDGVEWAWGEEPWGGEFTGLQDDRILVPLEQHRAKWLIFKISTGEAYKLFACNGISIIYENVSER